MTGYATASTPARASVQICGSRLFSGTWVGTPAALVSPGEEVRRGQLVGEVDVTPVLVLGHDLPPLPPAAGPKEPRIAAPDAVGAVGNQLRRASPHSIQGGVLGQLHGAIATQVEPEDLAETDDLAHE